MPPIKKTGTHKGKNFFLPLCYLNEKKRNLNKKNTFKSHKKSTFAKILKQANSAYYKGLP